MIRACGSFSSPDLILAISSSSAFIKSPTVLIFSLFVRSCILSPFQSSPPRLSSARPLFFGGSDKFIRHRFTRDQKPFPDSFEHHRNRHEQTPTVKRRVLAWFLFIFGHPLFLVLPPRVPQIQKRQQEDAPTWNEYVSQIITHQFALNPSRFFQFLVTPNLQPEIAPVFISEFFFNQNRAPGRQIDFPVASGALRPLVAARKDIHAFEVRESFSIHSPHPRLLRHCLFPILGV